METLTGGWHDESVALIAPLRRGQHGVRAEIMIGDVHVEAEEFQEAVSAYGRAEQKAKEMDDQELLENARQKLKKAQVFLEQSKKKDYYKVSVSLCMYLSCKLWDTAHFSLFLLSLIIVPVLSILVLGYRRHVFYQSHDRDFIQFRGRSHYARSSIISASST